jgi:vacuolar-type H+-ATPase subunit D/Vma8
MRIPFLRELIFGSPQKLRPASPGFEKRLEKLAFLVHTLMQKEQQMSHEIEDLVAEVADIKTVVDAVITDHAALIERINAAVDASDLSAVASVTLDLKAQADRLRAMIAPTVDAPIA